MYCHLFGTSYIRDTFGEDVETFTREPSMSDVIWLKVKAKIGPFSNEYTVLGSTFEGKTFSLYAPENSVRFISAPARTSTQSDALMRVTVIAANADMRLVSLPANPLDSSRTVKVRTSQLVA